MIIPQYKGQSILIKRIAPSGCKAATLTERRLKVQAFDITRKIDQERPRGVQDGGGTHWY